MPAAPTRAPLVPPPPGGGASNGTDSGGGKLGVPPLAGASSWSWSMGPSISGLATIIPMYTPVFPRGEESGDPPQGIFLKRGRQGNILGLGRSHRQNGIFYCPGSCKTPPDELEGERLGETGALPPPLGKGFFFLQNSANFLRNSPNVGSLDPPNGIFRPKLQNSRTFPQNLAPMMGFFLQNPPNWLPMGFDSKSPNFFLQ